MINLNNSLVPDGSFYVAVSGGVDSIAGVDLLHRFNPGRVKIFHYNHNLRERNHTMQAAVEAYAEYRNIPLVISIRGSDIGDSEAALRVDRMDAYKALNSDIVVCHHLDDAVESYIMRMIEGNPEYVPIPTQTFFTNSNNRIFRPFLRTYKQDFIDYVDKKNLDVYVVEDETNYDSSYCRRNYIRNEVVPKFKGMGLPKVVLKKFYL